ncbi:MAG TPA: chemotaxis protein CheW [Candidatus Acidoferrales bacterium]|nr:chemotaxis protein CheW [Candidatus Acidoferrales bacterium]
MNAAETTSRDSYVLLQIGARRFALPAALIAELAPPVRLHTFPHASALISGVIVRRGRIVPVYDASAELCFGRAFTHRFYLILRRPSHALGEFAALPVDGECELASGEVQPAEAGAPRYVSGMLATGDGSVSILDFEALVASSVVPSGQRAQAERPS